MEPGAFTKAISVLNPTLEDPTTGGTKPPTSPNYTRTADPNIVIGKHGVKISLDDMNEANKQGMAWTNLDNFADWMGSWAHKLPDFKKMSPYYRTYPSGQIKAGDMALLMAKDDPKINAILGRNIAGEGEIPQYGENDSDVLKAYLKQKTP